MVTREELYALAHMERDPQRIVSGIDQLSASNAEADVVACIRAHGHLARRFRYFDGQRVRAIVARGKMMQSGAMERAIADLREDLSIYVDQDI